MKRTFFEIKFPRFPRFPLIVFILMQKAGSRIWRIPISQSEHALGEERGKEAFQYTPLSLESSSYSFAFPKMTVAKKETSSVKSYAFFNITSSFDLDETTYITFLKEETIKSHFEQQGRITLSKTAVAERKGGNRGNSPSPPANKGQIEGGEEGEGARGWKPSQVGRASFRTQRRRPDHEGLHGPTNSLLPVKRDREIFLKYENLTHFFSMLSRETGSKRVGHRFGFPTTAAQKWTHEQEKEKERPFSSSSTSQPILAHFHLFQFQIKQRRFAAAVPHPVALSASLPTFSGFIEIDFRPLPPLPSPLPFFSSPFFLFPFSYFLFWRRQLTS